VHLVPTAVKVNSGVVPLSVPEAGTGFYDWSPADSYCFNSFSRAKVKCGVPPIGLSTPARYLAAGPSPAADHSRCADRSSLRLRGIKMEKSTGTRALEGRPAVAAPRSATHGTLPSAWAAVPPASPRRVRAHPGCLVSPEQPGHHERIAAPCVGLSVILPPHAGTAADKLAAPSRS
jgi:hypothetical protein